MKRLEYIAIGYKPTSKELCCEYYVEPNRISMEKACENIAGESSIGTWTTISTMNKSIAHKLKPKVYYINKKTGEVRIAYPEQLFEEGNMPEILSSIAGNIFGMRILRKLRLQDIKFPKSILRSFKGPRYGIKGIRKLLKVKKRPLVGTIVKPKVGLTAKQHAKVAYDAWAGGLDVVKDDENLSSMKFNRFNERIRETLKLRDKAEKETGEKKMYMANTTAETLEMLRRADYVKQLGGEYAMVDILTTGWAGVQSLRDHVKQVIHAHRAMHASVTKDPHHGISMLTIAKIARLIGVDQLHIGTAHVGKMGGSVKEIVDIEEEIEDRMIKQDTKSHILEQNWGSIKPVFAVASGGLYPGGLPKVMERMGNNIVMQCGGGVHGNKLGTRAGARAVRQAVDAVMKKEDFRDYANKHKELKQAVSQWGIA